MTLEALLNEASARLSSAGIDDARTNAEYLLMKSLGLTERFQLRSKSNDEVSSLSKEQFDGFIERRLLREPVQYILGEWEFFGLPMIVGPGVLIPRPETEVLVEETLKEAALRKDHIHILDIGTGSGAIALALASRLPAAQIVGIDISNAALDIARQNADRLRCSGVRFERIDIFDDQALQRLPPQDIIVSNPPYISSNDFESLDPELRLYEPREALTDESNGLRFYERIARCARTLLDPGGRILVELEYGKSDEVAQLFLSEGMRVLRIVNDLAGIPRVLCAAR